ncbi:MAG: hypothetical protein KG029_16165 [Bacteroidetes bacterium]|nr:hypothetical protein [Bacteroidota bacterium]
MIRPSDNKKNCLECGDELMGRSDKKFCNDQCRSVYNQKLNGDAAELIRNVNNQLRKNRSILSKLNPEGKTSVKKAALEKKGFNFKLFTSTYTTKENRTYYYVYDQGYLQLENDYFMLVLNKDF